MMNANKPVGLILDDHQLFGEVFIAHLKNSMYFSNQHAFLYSLDLLDFLEKNVPSKVYVFMDYFLTDGNPFQLIDHVHEKHPYVTIIMLTSLNNPVVLRKLLSMKVSGVISKKDGFDDILRSVNAGSRQRPFISNTMRKIISDAGILNDKEVLTLREIQLLSLIANGKSTDDIVSTLEITKNTVLTHRKKIISKLGLTTITDAVAYAIRCGIVEG